MSKESFDFDFRLKHFGIRQSHTAMKVGTDAIALGAWVASWLEGAERILDVGAGTGILSLMMAQAFASAKIDAIDLDAGAVADASYNFALSPWGSRLHLHEGDALAYSSPLPYDLIISNPPYFATSAVRSGEASRALARQEHSEGLGIASLISKGKELLSPMGRLCLVLPSDREWDLRLAATINLMYIERLCLLSSTEGVPVRLLASLRPLACTKTKHTTNLQSLILRTSSGEYSDEYSSLIAPFIPTIS